MSTSSDAGQTASAYPDVPPDRGPHAPPELGHPMPEDPLRKEILAYVKAAEVRQGKPIRAGAAELREYLSDKLGRRVGINRVSRELTALVKARLLSRFKSWEGFTFYGAADPRMSMPGVANSRSRPNSRANSRANSQPGSRANSQPDPTHGQTHGQTHSPAHGQTHGPDPPRIQKTD